MNELALFAGAGGGILAGHLNGWRCVCAVERDAYCAQLLAARQNDGTLPPFPIWSDVCSFDGRPWRGLVDVVSGGFPCQDISAAGKGAGIDGERSGLWREMARIIDEVRPRYVFVENTPLLVRRGAARVIGDLAQMGYDAQWGCLSASDLGAPHQRDRFWLVAHPQLHRLSQRWGTAPAGEESMQSAGISGDVAPRLPQQTGVLVSDPDGQSMQGMEQGPQPCGLERPAGLHHRTRGQRAAMPWPLEPDVGRVADGVAHRVDRLAALGNGQVPSVAATAFQLLGSDGNG